MQLKLADLRQHFSPSPPAFIFFNLHEAKKEKRNSQSGIKKSFFCTSSYTHNTTSEFPMLSKQQQQKTTTTTMIL